jgi:hypothetical protein
MDQSSNQSARVRMNLIQNKISFKKFRSRVGLGAKESFVWGDVESKLDHDRD